MPKVSPRASPSEGHSTPSQSPTTFRPHTRSPSSLKRNQACKQCRKRKTKCDAGRPCKGCLRSHAVVISNLVKQGLPYDHLQAECIYDSDEYSPPTHVMMGPSQLQPEFQQLEPYMTIPSGLFSSPTSQDVSLFGSEAHLDISSLSPDVQGYRYAMPRTSECVPQTMQYPYSVPEPRSQHYYQQRTPSSYQQPRLLPRSYECDPTRHSDPRSEWMYPSAHTEYNQVEEAALSRMLWKSR